MENTNTTDFDKESLRNLLHGLHDDVLEIFDTLWEKQRKYPRGKNHLSMKPLQFARARTSMRVVNFITEVDTSDAGYCVTAVEVASGGKYHRIPIDGSDECYKRCIDVLFTKHYTNFVTLCIGGRKGSFGPIIRQFYEPFIRQGINITPCSRPPTIDGLRFTNTDEKNPLTWEIRDWNSSFDTGDVLWSRVMTAKHVGPEKMLELLDAATRISTYMKQQFSIRIQPTIGRTGVEAVRTNTHEDFVKTRPDPLLRAMLEFGHGARAGQQWAIPSRGVGFKIDRNKSYPSEFRWALPTHSTFVVCKNVEEWGHGHYLCHIEGYAPRPQQIALWDKYKKEFIPIPFLRGSGYAVLQSVEFGALERMGVKVTPLFGYAIDQWDKFGAFDALFVAALHDAETDVILKNYLKSIAVAFVGSMARKPEFDNVMYSEDAPEGDWWPLTANDLTVMKNWWVQTTEGWSCVMQLDAAAWVWSCAREALMTLMCDLMDQGIWPVHAHTDSLIADGRVPSGLPIGEGIGDWKIEGERRRYIINGPGWYEFEGERSRQSGFDRTWHELTHDPELIAENEQRYTRERYTENVAPEVDYDVYYRFNQPLQKCKPPTEAHKWMQLLYNDEWVA